MYDVLIDTPEEPEVDTDVPEADTDATEPLLPAPPSPAEGIRDLPADVPLCPWTDENVMLYEPPSAGPRFWVWDWIRAEFVNPVEFREIIRWKWDPIRRMRYRSIHPVSDDESPALNDPSHDLIINVPMPELPRAPPCTPNTSDKSESHDNNAPREAKPAKSEYRDDNDTREAKHDKSEYRENAMPCVSDDDSLADTADSGAPDAGPSGTAAYHPGIPSYDDSSDESDDNDDPVFESAAAALQGTRNVTCDPWPLVYSAPNSLGNAPLAR